MMRRLFTMGPRWILLLGHEAIHLLRRRPFSLRMVPGVSGRVVFTHRFASVPTSEREWLDQVGLAVPLLAHHLRGDRAGLVVVGGLDVAARVTGSAPLEEGFVWCRAAIHGVWFGMRAATVDELTASLGPLCRSSIPFVPMACLVLGRQPAAAPGEAASALRVERQCAQVILVGTERSPIPVEPAFLRLIFIGRRGQLWEPDRLRPFVSAELERMRSVGIALEDSVVETIEGCAAGVSPQRILREMDGADPRLLRAWWRHGRARLAAAKPAGPACRFKPRPAWIALLAGLTALAASQFRATDSAPPRADAVAITARQLPGEAEAWRQLEDSWNATPRFIGALRELEEAFESVGDCWIESFQWNAAGFGPAGAAEVRLDASILNRGYPQPIEEGDTPQRARALSAACADSRTVVSAEAEAFDGRDPRHLDFRMRLEVGRQLPPQSTIGLSFMVHEAAVVRAELGRSLFGRAGCPPITLDLLEQEMRLAELSETYRAVISPAGGLREWVGDVPAGRREMRIVILEHLLPIFSAYGVNISRIHWVAEDGETVTFRLEWASDPEFLRIFPGELWTALPSLRVERFSWTLGSPLDRPRPPSAPTGPMLASFIADFSVHLGAMEKVGGS